MASLQARRGRQRTARRRTVCSATLRKPPAPLTVRRRDLARGTFGPEQEVAQNVSSALPREPTESTSDALSRDQAAAMLVAGEIAGPRDAAVIALLLLNGLRASEIGALEAAALGTEGGPLTRHHLTRIVRRIARAAGITSDPSLHVQRPRRRPCSPGSSSPIFPQASRSPASPVTRVSSSGLGAGASSAV